MILTLALLLFAAPPAPDRLDALAFLAGTWEGDQGGVHLEEHWMPPRGGAMLGVHRDVKGDRMVSFEFIRIAVEPEGITYWASPRGQSPPTPFRLKESSPGRVVFENAEHDFPQRVLYWLEKDGALHARVEGTIQGKLESEEWRWTKAK